jgi:hypothetical protein
VTAGGQACPRPCSSGPGETSTAAPATPSTILVNCICFCGRRLARLAACSPILPIPCPRCSRRHPRKHAPGTHVRRRHAAGGRQLRRAAHGR